MRRPGPLRFGAAVAGLATAAVLGLAPASADPAAVTRYEIVEMAIPRSLTDQPGNAERGQRLALNRAKGNCITCHQMPLEADFQGDIGPPLAGVASRYEPGELRLRLVDSKQINPDSNMPSYHRIANLTGVRREFVGQPILTAQEVEDVLAFLLTLR